MLKKMFIEDIEARIRNLEKTIITNPPHREYLEGQLSAYRYVVAMMAEIEEVRYPEYDKTRRVGLFCERCRLIMYVDQYHVDPIMRKGCLDCGGDLIWITSDRQPEGDGF